jgi:hypothetical protein
LLLQHQVFRLLQTGIAGYDIFGYFAGTEEDGVVAYQVARPVQLADGKLRKKPLCYRLLDKVISRKWGHHLKVSLQGCKFFG